MLSPFFDQYLSLAQRVKDLSMDFTQFPVPKERPLGRQKAADHQDCIFDNAQSNPLSVTKDADVVISNAAALVPPA